MQIRTQAPTFEQFLASFPQLCQDIKDIQRMLLQKIEVPIEADKWFDIDEFCEYHPEKPAKPTVYNWVSNDEVPSHKRGKKLYFLKSEIDTWLKAGRKKTLAEINAEADSYLQSKKKRG